MTSGGCRVCGRVERWDSFHATGCAMTWHVYEEHPETWQLMFGNTKPVDPRPETVGVRL